MKTATVDYTFTQKIAKSELITNIFFLGFQATTKNYIYLIFASCKNFIQSLVWINVISPLNVLRWNWSTYLKRYKKNTCIQWNPWSKICKTWNYVHNFILRCDGLMEINARKMTRPRRPLYRWLENCASSVTLLCSFKIYSFFNTLFLAGRISGVIKNRNMKVLVSVSWWVTKKSHS